MTPSKRLGHELVRDLLFFESCSIHAFRPAVRLLRLLHLLTFYLLFDLVDASDKLLVLKVVNLLMFCVLTGCRDKVTVLGLPDKLLF